MPRGRLYGLGIAPGDPELLTLKALRLLQAAQLCELMGQVKRTGDGCVRE